MINRLAAATAAILLSVTALPAQESQINVANVADTVSLSLDDCLRIALSNNPTVKVADMEVKRMDYSKIETLSQLLPNIAFNGTYSRAIAKQVAYMNMDFGDLLGGGGKPGLGGGDSDESASRAVRSRAMREDGGIEMGLDNSYQLGFNASVPLIAPQLWAAMKLSDTQILASVEQARASRLDLINEVKSAYYALLLAYDSQAVIQQSYDMAAFTHDLYQKKYELGAASDYDVLRTSVAMKNVEPQLIQADIAIRQTRLRLLILMGLDASFPMKVDGTLEEYEKTMYADAMNASRDYSANTQLVLNDIQMRQLKQNLTMNRNALYPTLALAANYSWTSSQDGSPFKGFRWSPYSMVNLSLSVPLFTGGSRYSRIKQAQIQVDEMQWQRQNLERNVAMQVDLAVENINLNVKQIASSSESVRQATRAHDIMEKSFAIGAASYLDLRDSELSLTQSRLAYYQSIYNYLIAQSSLELLLGNAPIDTYTAK